MVMIFVSVGNALPGDQYLQSEADALVEVLEGPLFHGVVIRTLTSVKTKASRIGRRPGTKNAGRRPAEFTMQACTRHVMGAGEDFGVLVRVSDVPARWIRTPYDEGIARRLAEVYRNVIAEQIGRAKGGRFQIQAIVALDGAVIPPSRSHIRTTITSLRWCSWYKVNNAV